MIVVDDDSPDGTYNEVMAMAEEDPRIRCLRRVGRRGLSSAVVEGALAANAPVVAVMDADRQHDEQKLPLMFERMSAVPTSSSARAMAGLAALAPGTTTTPG